MKLDREDARWQLMMCARREDLCWRIKNRGLTEKAIVEQLLSTLYGNRLVKCNIRSIFISNWRNRENETMQLKELLRLSQRSVMLRRSFGWESLRTLEQALEIFGLTLGMSADEIKKVFG